MSQAVDPALEGFVAARTGALVRAAYLLTGDRGLAEDLVQTVFIKVAPRWGRIVAAGDPEGYVRTVLYREHVSRWRLHRGREVLSAEGGLTDAPSPDQADMVLERLALGGLLAQLNRRQRAVLVLRYYEDLSEGATARVLNCSVGTVRSQTARALAKLRVLAIGDVEGAAR
jgi:RNA polymerase sigma-70 factor (sigma-E family)